MNDEKKCINGDGKLYMNADEKIYKCWKKCINGDEKWYVTADEKVYKCWWKMYINVDEKFI